LEADTEFEFGIFFSAMVGKIYPRLRKGRSVGDTPGNSKFHIGAGPIDAGSLQSGLKPPIDFCCTGVM